VKFVQVIEFKTKKIDEIQKLDQEWEAATKGKRTAERVVVCQDRDNPGRYFVIAQFPSYEAAQKNNELPETQEFAQKQMALADGPPTFYNLDVIDEPLG
jgi:quinol monooxygenase YgiN